MDSYLNLINELKESANPDKIEILSSFFKTGKGEYGEGDVFIGVVVPENRKISQKYTWISNDEINSLLKSDIHEVRLSALFIMVNKMKKAKEEEQKELFDLYLSNTDRINNWDLVDLSAPQIIGCYLKDKSRSVLYDLIESEWLWNVRIGIVATLAFIRNNDLDDTYAIAERTMSNTHDLIQKAGGWMLREAGKRDKERLFRFIDSNKKIMPRTMLRYSVEKFSKEERAYLMRR